MIAYPNAKINLGLNILSKRPDGYHNLSSCFYPIPLCDIIEVLPASTFQFSSSGINIPDDGQSNLCIRAYEMLKEDYNIGPVSIHLHKIIPVGAGLGGGSSDASFVIKCLNTLFNLALDRLTMEDYAAKLGSDCPFFIENKPVLAEGTGNVFNDISINLEGHYLVLANPGVHVSTAQAYSRVIPKNPDQSIQQILRKPIAQWQGQLINDFEESVFQQFPEIKRLKNDLINAGASYTSMSGSGASVFGIFNSKTKLPTQLARKVIWQGALTQ